MIWLGRGERYEGDKTHADDILVVSQTQQVQSSETEAR